LAEFDPSLGDFCLAAHLGRRPDRGRRRGSRSSGVGGLVGGGSGGAFGNFARMPRSVLTRGDSDRFR